MLHQAAHLHPRLWKQVATDNLRNSTGGTPCPPRVTMPGNQHTFPGSGRNAREPSVREPVLDKQRPPHGGKGEREPDRGDPQRHVDSHITSVRACTHPRAQLHKKLGASSLQPPPCPTSGLHPATHHSQSRAPHLCSRTAGWLAAAQYLPHFPRPGRPSSPSLRRKHEAKEVMHGGQHTCPSQPTPVRQANTVVRGVQAVGGRRAVFAPVGRSQQCLP